MHKNLWGSSGIRCKPETSDFHDMIPVRDGNITSNQMMSVIFYFGGGGGRVTDKGTRLELGVSVELN